MKDTQKALSDEDRENLVAYLDGELDARTAESMEARLSTDAHARTEAETLRKTWELLDFLARPQASATFSSRTLERVSAFRPAATAPLTKSGVVTPAARLRWRPWLLGAGWAASVLVAAALGYGGVSLLVHPRAVQAPAEADPADIDAKLIQNLRVVENKHLYDHADSLEFLRGLDDPELFGDD